MKIVFWIVVAALGALFAAIWLLGVGKAYLTVTQ